MDDLNKATDPDARAALMAQAQTIVSEDYVNGYLFELAYPTIAKADLQGMWENQPTAAVDLTGLSWTN
jgi:peptide/nickel transport system substrate-binding protein